MQKLPEERRHASLTFQVAKSCFSFEQLAPRPCPYISRRYSVLNFSLRPRNNLPRQSTELSRRTLPLLPRYSFQRRNVVKPTRLMASEFRDRLSIVSRVVLREEEEGIPSSRDDVIKISLLDAPSNYSTSRSCTYFLSHF